MSCAIWEERVALFAGGDLGTAEAAAVERHLRQCAACSSLAADLRLELDELREAHAEPLAAEHYAAVRGRVLAELAKSPRRRVVWAWAWAAALAAAAAAVLIVAMTKPTAIPAPDLPRLAVAAPPVEATAHRGSNRSLTVAAPKRVVAPRGAVPAIKEQTPMVTEIATPTPPAPAPPAPVEDSPVHMVQLATDDPNVVIYWQLEGTGE